MPGRHFAASCGWPPAVAAVTAAPVREDARILNGTNPADLLVEQASKFELELGLKKAKTLGVAIPQSILLRANRVIE